MPEKFPHPLPLFSQKPHPPAPFSTKASSPNPFSQGRRGVRII